MRFSVSLHEVQCSFFDFLLKPESIKKVVGMPPDTKDLLVLLLSVVNKL